MTTKEMIAMSLTWKQEFIVKENSQKVLNLCKKIWGEARVPIEFRFNPNFKYYAVGVNFGHLSHNKSYLRTRYMRAKDIMDAMAHAKRMPRAKKHRSDVVSGIREITYKEYLLGKLDELQDNYLRLNPSKGKKFDFNLNLCWVN